MPAGNSVHGAMLLGARLACAWLACAALSSAHAEDPAGRVSALRGGAFVERDGSSRNLKIADAVYERDRIVTGSGARVALKLGDGTLISLGERTRFAVQRYAPRRDEDGGVVLELLRGAFRAVTGRVGGGDSTPLKVRTPVADIGVRGTDFWGGFVFSEALDVALLGGGPITIENAAGRVEIASPGHGTTVRSADTAPTPPKQWGEKKLQDAAKATAIP